MRRDSVTVLRALRALRLDTCLDETTEGAWLADCPVCRVLTDALWPLRITEPYPGGDVTLCCVSGCDEWEILRCLGLSSEEADDSAGERPRLRLLDVERMLVTVPPRVPWLVDPLVALGAVTMLVGREGQGKSMFGNGLAAAVGHGRPFAGMGCSQGRALIVDAENGEAEAHRRIRALGVKPDTLKYVEADGFDLRRDLADLEALIREHGPSLVMLDSLRSLAPGLDENDSAPVEAALGPLRGLARRHECALLVLHHAGKASRGYRGSTAIGAAVDLGFELARHEHDPQARTRRELSCWKSRIAAEPSPSWINLAVHDGHVAIQAAEPFTRSEALERGEDALARRFGEIVTGRGELSRGELCAAAGVNPNDGTTARALERALATSAIEKVRHGVYGPPRRSSIHPAPQAANGWMNPADTGERVA